MTEPPNIQDRLQHADTILKISYDNCSHDKPRFITGYWSIRGLGAPIRMMLSAAQVNHWVVLYDVTERDNDDGGTWNKDSWMAEKEWMRKDYNVFANLPFLIDCHTDMVLVQTNAIFSYLGRELNLLGSSPAATCRCEELLCELMDLRNLMVRFAYQQAKDDDGDEYVTAKAEAGQIFSTGGAADRILDKLEAYLSDVVYPNVVLLGLQVDTYNPSRICHLVDHTLSAPDFHLWELLDQYIGLCDYYDIPNVFVKDAGGGGTKEDRRPYLYRFWQDFAALEENQPHLKSSALVDLPVNNPYARFGSKPLRKDGKVLDATYERGNSQKALWKGQGVVVETRIKMRKKQKVSAKEELLIL